MNTKDKMIVLTYNVQEALSEFDDSIENIKTVNLNVDYSQLSIFDKDELINAAHNSFKHYEKLINEYDKLIKAIQETIQEKC